MKTLATKSEIFKAAHKLTKETRKATDSYSATFSICLKYIYSQLKNTKMEQVEKTIEELKNEITEVIRQESRVTKELAKEKAGQRIENHIKFASFANSDLFTLIKEHFELKPNRSDTAMFGVYKENRNVKCVFINYQDVIDSYDTFDVSVTYTKHPTPESKIEHRFKVVFRPEPKFVDEDDFNFVIPTFFKHLVENSVITVKAADKLHDCFF